MKPVVFPKTRPHFRPSTTVIISYQYDHYHISTLYRPCTDLYQIFTANIAPNSSSSPSVSLPIIILIFSINYRYHHFLELSPIICLSISSSVYSSHHDLYWRSVVLFLPVPTRTSRLKGVSNFRPAPIKIPYMPFFFSSAGRLLKNDGGEESSRQRATMLARHRRVLGLFGEGFNS